MHTFVVDHIPLFNSDIMIEIAHSYSNAHVCIKIPMALLHSYQA